MASGWPTAARASTVRAVPVGSAAPLAKASIPPPSTCWVARYATARCTARSRAAGLSAAGVAVGAGAWADTPATGTHRTRQTISATARALCRESDTRVMKNSPFANAHPGHGPAQDQCASATAKRASLRVTRPVTLVRRKARHWGRHLSHATSFPRRVCGRQQGRASWLQRLRAATVAGQRRTGTGFPRVAPHIRATEHPCLGRVCGFPDGSTIRGGRGLSNGSASRRLSRLPHGLAPSRAGAAGRSGRCRPCSRPHTEPGDSRAVPRAPPRLTAAHRVR